MGKKIPDRLSQGPLRHTGGALAPGEVGSHRQPELIGKLCKTFWRDWDQLVAGRPQRSRTVSRMIAKGGTSRGGRRVPGGWPAWCGGVTARG
jgi:hypothetical protein